VARSFRRELQNASSGKFDGRCVLNGGYSVSTVVPLRDLSTQLGVERQAGSSYPTQLAVTKAEPNGSSVVEVARRECRHMEQLISPSKICCVCAE
jgi:hypothetical protein